MSSVGSRLIHGSRTGQHPNECGLFRSCLKDAAADPNMFHAVKQQGCMPERVFSAGSEKAAAKAVADAISQLLAQLEKAYQALRQGHQLSSTRKTAITRWNNLRTGLAILTLIVAHMCDDV